MLAQADRIAFSLNIISAPATVAALAAAKAQLSSQLTVLQNLDNANANLLSPINAMVNAYQTEYSDLDGNGRSTFSESDIQNAGGKKLNNFFFPNNSATVVPSLSATNNIWAQTTPYALTYAIGKNGSEAYPAVTSETGLIAQILGYITSAATHPDIENTSGQNATAGNPGAIPPVPDSIQPYAVVQTLKTNLVAAVNSYIALLTAEAAAIVTTDKNSVNQANNNAAIAAIPTIKSALSTWLAFPDFQSVPGSVSTFAAFYAYNSNLLAPTKLHSVQLAALKSAILARQTAVASRLAQLAALMGTISQDVTSGAVTGSGLYLKRYNFLVLRLNSLGGSLTQLLSLAGTTTAQDSIASSVTGTANTYLSILPTSKLAGPANGTNVISVMNGALFAPGDSVFIYAEGQTEMQYAIKSIVQNQITLNSAVPSKFTPASGARMYKDLT